MIYCFTWSFRGYSPNCLFYSLTEPFVLSVLFEGIFRRWVLCPARRSFAFMVILYFSFVRIPFWSTVFVIFKFIGFMGFFCSTFYKLYTALGYTSSWLHTQVLEGLFTVCSCPCISALEGLQLFGSPGTVCGFILAFCTVVGTRRLSGRSLFSVSLALMLLLGF